MNPVFEHQMGRLVNDWSLAQAYAKFKNSSHASFAILSAGRTNEAYGGDRSFTDSLRADLSPFPDSVALVGNGQEDEVVNGKKTKATFRTVERFFWVNGIAKAEARSLAAKYGQDRYVFAGPETQGDLILYSTSTNGVAGRSQGFHPEAVSQFYSKWKGSPFYFEAAVEGWMNGVAVQGEIKKFVNHLLEQAGDFAR